MKKYLFHPVFVMASLLFVIHQVLQKIFEISIPLFDNYGDDFVGMPIILTIFLVEQRFIWKRVQTNLSLFQVVVFTILFAVFFENILPLFNHNYTADYWDYLAYGLGSWFFFITINKS
ncbi:MAG: hypothetical protein ACPGXZ_01685 [Saprospiraceae bacterium]